MQVQTLDAVFVRAPRSRIHPIVADIAGWGRWWPGVAIRPAGAGRAEVTLRPPGLRRRRQRWTLEITRVRRDLGIDFCYSGDVAGAAEFYYLDEPAGTVVHYALRGEVADARWRVMVRSHRAGARAALDALKDRLEHDRLPGAEPAEALLQEQLRATAAFDRAVAAGQRRQPEGDRS